MSRIAVVSDRIGACDPSAAGRALGRAFADARPGRDQVAVVPAASGGRDLASALSALGRPFDVLVVTDPEQLADALASALGRRPGRLLVDLSRVDAPTPDALIRIVASCQLDASATELIGVLPHAEQHDRLLGLEGLAARRGFETGRPRADVLALDAELGGLASGLGVEDRPGLGAAGGLPLIIVALGGRLTTGFSLCADATNLARTIAQADLVVVGVDTFTTGNFGGPVVLGLTSLLADLPVACLAVARHVEIGTRELRRHGIESAAELGGEVDLGVSEIIERARPIVRTWLP